jgi:beta-glucuronidase
MSFIISIILITILSGNLPAQNEPLIQNPDGRRGLSLDGAWQIIIDPYDNGYYDYRYQPRGDGYFLNQKPRSESDLVEYDFDRSETLNVPGDWNSQQEKLFLYEGTIWYKKDFQYHKQTGHRLFLYFGAANYEAQVYLNGQKIGEHIGGFTPFNFEVTDQVTDGNNFLIVRVNDQRRREGVPTLNTDWWNYGGLTRSVRLIETPQTFIRDYFIQLKKDSRDTLQGWIRLDENNLKQSLKVNIPAAGISQKVTTDEQGYAEFAFKGKLELWSPANPKLYDVEIAAESDTVTDRIGFRTIRCDGPKLLLNGSPIFLRGVSIHEQAPLREGRACTAADDRQLLTWAKEAGCNFVRLAHYPHNEPMLRIADEMGLLVWSEIPVYWTILFDNPEVYQNASRQLSEVLSRDKNRAAIIIWSVGNETPRGDARLEFLKGLIRQIRESDPTRLISAATELNYADNTIIINDPLGNYLDVIGANEYLGWYVRKPEEIPLLAWKNTYSKPLIITEFGAGAKFGYHGKSVTRWTEEYQNHVYELQIEMLQKIPCLAGITPWILTDFRSPRRPLPEIQDFYNRKGLISEKGEKKMAFYTLQKFYQQLRLQR